MEFMCKGCFLWKIQGVENGNIIDLCKNYLEMSFGIFGNEFWHFGNEFCLFSGNEFRPKRAKKGFTVRCERRINSYRDVIGFNWM